MLSRPQFQIASSAFARRYPQWQYVGGHRPGYNFLTRTTTHFSNSPASSGDIDLEVDDVEADDVATAKQRVSSILTVQEHIVYSASFNVPAFYFTAHDTNGAPCSLAELVTSSLFKAKPPPESETTDYALTLPRIPFPLLSQGDHPTLGTPCWYFHPCETDAAVNEFMRELEDVDWTEEARLLRWMEIWVMIVGSVLNVHSP